MSYIPMEQQESRASNPEKRDEDVGMQREDTDKGSTDEDEQAEKMKTSKR